MLKRAGLSGPPLKWLLLALRSSTDNNLSNVSYPSHYLPSRNRTPAHAHEAEKVFDQYTHRKAPFLCQL
jgi:hypothetical protein